MLNEMIKKAEAYGRTVEFDSLGLDGTVMFFDPYFEINNNGKVQIQTTTQGFFDAMEEIFGYSVDIDKAKPTNSEFIVTIADKLRLEIGSVTV